MGLRFTGRDLEEEEEKEEEEEEKEEEEEGIMDMNIDAIEGPRAPAVKPERVTQA